MFMSAGLIYAALGHDRLAGLGGIARVLPLSVLAFALGGVALIGLPPSGAYLAKELLLAASGQTGQWWWAVVIQSGGILTGSYMVLVLVHALAPGEGPVTLRAPVSRSSEAAALALATCSLLLGFVRWDAYLPIPRVTLPNPFALGTLLAVLWPILGGAVLAILLGRWGPPERLPFGRFLVVRVGPAQRSALTVGRMIERLDSRLRQWPAATVSLVLVAILLGAALLAAR
jgi:multicomponent Na+:H+ antiporter subunit D